MRVRVKLFAQLRKYLSDPSGTTAVELPAGATVRELIAQLGLPADRAGVIVSKDEHLELSSVLHDDQEVSLFPPLAGG